MSRLPAKRPEPKRPARQPRIGLALGGGGARGIAHILMLEALDELGLKPAVIAGTSIGAIYGAAYAAGMPARSIRAHTEEMLGNRLDLVRQLISARASPVQRLLNLLPLPTAILNPEAVLEVVLPSRMPKDFAGLAIPLRIVATDFYGQEPVIFSSGRLVPAIAASMALPAIFQPVFVEGRALVDGGLVNPLPFDIVAADCDVTIAVDVSAAIIAAEPASQPSAMDAIVGATQILQRSIIREKLRATRPDIYIDAGLDDFSMLEFHRFAEILAAAQPAKAVLKRQLQRVISSHTIEPQLPAATLELIASSEVPEPATTADRPGRKGGGRRLLRRKRR